MTAPDPVYVDILSRLAAASDAAPPDQTVIDDLTSQLHARYLEITLLGGATTGGLPYPAPTDPVAQGADAIRALAEAVEKRYQSGTVAIAATNVTTVTFKTAFKTPPAVVANVIGSGAVAVAYVTDITTTQFGIRIYTLGSAQVAGNASWVAVGVPA